MKTGSSEKWHWQEPGNAWKGAALYHVTLTVTDRSAILGQLVTPDGNPAKAFVVRTPLGDALVDSLMNIPRYHPEVRVLHFCLMPDHLHAIIYVQRTMEKGIRTVMRGFWQGAKKQGRACAAIGCGVLNDIQEKHKEGLSPAQASIGSSLPSLSSAPASTGQFSFGPSSFGASSFISPNIIRAQLKAESQQLQDIAATLRAQMGDEAYYSLPPLFDDMPFIRPMSRYSQLQNTIRYIDMNPQRLATKRLRPGFFRVQKGIDIGGRSYDGVGNIALLMQERYDTVHVRRQMVEMAEHGNDLPLRDYKNSCVLKARHGEVMVSPFISLHEKQVMQVLQQEHRLMILLTDNGFRDYYKPSDKLFDDCAAGRLLILSPWQYDSGKHHISRADCVALNTMADDICKCLNDASK